MEEISTKECGMNCCIREILFDSAQIPSEGFFVKSNRMLYLHSLAHFQGLQVFAANQQSHKMAPKLNKQPPPTKPQTKKQNHKPNQTRKKEKKKERETFLHIMIPLLLGKTFQILGKVQEFQRLLDIVLYIYRVTQLYIYIYIIIYIYSYRYGYFQIQFSHCITTYDPEVNIPDLNNCLNPSPGWPQVQLAFSSEYPALTVKRSSYLFHKLLQREREKRKGKKRKKKNSVLEKLEQMHTIMALVGVTGAST